MLRHNGIGTGDCPTAGSAIARHAAMAPHRPTRPNRIDGSESARVNLYMMCLLSEIEKCPRFGRRRRDGPATPPGATGEIVSLARSQWNRLSPLFDELARISSRGRRAVHVHLAADDAQVSTHAR